MQARMSISKDIRECIKDIREQGVEPRVLYLSKHDHESMPAFVWEFDGLPIVRLEVEGVRVVGLYE